MGNRLIIILLVVLLLLVTIGGALTYYLVLRPRTTIDLGEIYRLPEVFMTDLANRGHIRVEIHLELDNKRLSKELDKRQVQLIDTVYGILRSKSREDLSGLTGQEQLRQDLLAELNKLLSTGQITTLYFYQIVID